VTFWPYVAGCLCLLAALLLLLLGTLR